MMRVPLKGGDMNRTATGRGGSGSSREGSRARAGRAALIVGFAFGVAFGLALGAVAYFMSFKAAPSKVLASAIQLTGHPDIAEDLIWLFSGAFIGAMFAAYAAWRAEKGRADGLGKEHVLHRTFRVLDGGHTEGAAGEPSRNGKSGGIDRS